MALPDNVQVINAGDATRIVLPVRERTAPRWAGLVPIAFGLIFVCVGAGIIYGALHDAAAPAAPELPVGPEMPAQPPAAHGGLGWEQLLQACFGIPFMLVGLFPVALGFAVFFLSHAEVMVTADTLIAVDQMGPLPIRRKRRLSAIGRLRVGTLFQRTQNDDAQRLDPTNHCIFAEEVDSEGKASGSSFRLAQRYRTELLIPVAEFLLAEFKRRGSTALHTGIAAPLTVTVDPEPAAPPSDTWSPALEEQPPAQPVSSKIIFASDADTLTFVVPRTGFRGTALFFLLFSLFWDGISYPVFVSVVFQLLKDPSIENLGVVGFLSIFVIIGTFILLAAVQLAFRKSVLLATRDSLVLTQTGPIRKSEYQWTAGEIRGIRSGDSNTTINNRRLKELQVQSNKQPLRRGLLEGRDDAELEWLAAVLRGFYRVRT